MSAFTDALAALHADTNLTVACTWAYGPDREAPRTLLVDLVAEVYALSTDATSLRGIQSQPQDATFGGGPRGAIVPRQELDVAAADLPATPLRGDIITIGAETYVVEAAERDIEGVTWRLTLAET